MHRIKTCISWIPTRICFRLERTHSTKTKQLINKFIAKHDGKFHAMTETNAFTSNHEKGSKKPSHRRSSSRSRHSDSAKRKRGSPFLRIVGDVFFRLYTMLARFMFRFIYGDKGQSMPAITDPILLESATSLASKIRKQEVSHLLMLYYSSLNICNIYNPFLLY